MLGFSKVPVFLCHPVSSSKPYVKLYTLSKCFGITTNFKSHTVFFVKDLANQLSCQQHSTFIARHLLWAFPFPGSPVWACLIYWIVWVGSLCAYDWCYVYFVVPRARDNPPDISIAVHHTAFHLGGKKTHKLRLKHQTRHIVVK